MNEKLNTVGKASSEISKSSNENKVVENANQNSIIKAPENQTNDILGTKEETLQDNLDDLDKETIYLNDLDKEVINEAFNNYPELLSLNSNNILLTNNFYNNTNSNTNLANDDDAGVFKLPLDTVMDSVDKNNNLIDASLTALNGPNQSKYF